MVILKVVKGDLLEAKEKYICQQCNCVTLKPHGLSESISKKYFWGDPYGIRPKKTANTTSQPDEPGTIIELAHPTKPNDHPIILCFMSQWGPSTPNRFKHYNSSKNDDTPENRKKWFQECLDILDENKETYDVVAMPYYIGCGLAGGKWCDYESMLNNCKTKIVLYKL